MSQSQVVVLMVSIDTLAHAKQLARTLLQEQLAACVHCLPQGTSLYIWQDQLEETSEHTLLIKTRAGLSDKVTARIVELHPYEVPEVLEIPVNGGFPAYLNWVLQETQDIS